MKVLSLLSLVALPFLATSCRTQIPVDPMTMKQTCKCLPSHFQAKDPCACGKQVIAEK